MFEDAELISKFSREDAIKDHVLVDVRTPLFQDFDLKKMLGHNDSICFTDYLLNELIGMEDEKNTVQDFVRIIIRDMISTIQEMNEDGQSAGSRLLFKSTVMNEKKSLLIKLKSITHIEPNFCGIEKAKCITVMFEEED